MTDGVASEEGLPPPPKSTPQRDSVLYATGVILLPLGLIPLGFGFLILVGYGIAGSNDLGLLIPTLAICVAVSAAALIGGVRLIRRSYPDSST